VTFQSGAEMIGVCLVWADKKPAKQSFIKGQGSPNFANITRILKHDQRAIKFAERKAGKWNTKSSCCFGIA
jgi:hypothetical protein